ncbi:MAG TPA: hypothetical protein VK858_10830 [Longimicrobiales bacterium]|nr:hypothetical protein [Longimicrobiales bacterium]
MPSRSIFPSTLAVLALLAGCGEPGGSPGPGVTVSDSLGVAVHAWGHSEDDLDTWAYDPEPVLRLGALEGSTPDVFGRISSLVLGSDGGVTVTDDLAGEVRSFSASGTHVGTLGGLGEGPGEFSTSLALLRVAGDSVWVWDQRQRRLSIFAGGVFARSWTVPADVLLSRPVLVGSRVFGEANQRLTGLPETGMSRPPATVVVVGREGSASELLMSDGHERFLDIQMANGQISAVNVFQPPFARGFFFGVVESGGGARVIGGPNDRLALREWSEDGELRAIHRYAALDRPVTDARVQRAREVITARFDEPSPALRQQLDLLESTLPEYVPAFDRVWPDDENRLWVRRSVEDGVEEWMVLGVEDLRPLARIVLPRGFALMDVRTGLLGGRWLDELDVSHAQVYRLRTGA